MSEMGRVLCIRVVPENGDIIVLVGDLLIQHIQTIQQVEVGTLQFGRGESVELPYRYLVADPTTSEPLMAPGMRDIIYRDFDRTFDI